MEIAKEFFGIGKFKIEEMESEVDSIDDLLNLIYLINNEVIVICSSMEYYEKYITIFANSFKQFNNNKILVIVGNISEEKYRYSRSGVDYFINNDDKYVEKLNSIYEKLVENYSNLN